MPNRYSNDDRDDYYNERFRDRDYYEGRSGDYRDYDERSSRDYQPRRGSRWSEDEDRYSSQRDYYGNDQQGERFRSRFDEGRSSSAMAATGPHRGKGPKGYTRSDERIKEDVSDALMEDPQLDASEIEVTVKKGEVTLQGQVASRQDKRRAEDCAERCAGVMDIQNNIKVRSGAAQTAKGGEARN